MTSEAPKEMWPQKLFLAAYHRDEIVNYMQEDTGCDDAGEYTLTSHAKAMVAAERGACAETCDCRDREKPDSLYILGAIDANQAAARRIRAPDDAQAALDALLKAERVKGRVEALREALQAVDEWYRNIGEGTPAAEIAAMIEMEIKDDDV